MSAVFKYQNPTCDTYGVVRSASCEISRRLKLKEATAAEQKLLTFVGGRTNWCIGCTSQRRNTETQESKST